MFKHLTMLLLLIFAACASYDPSRVDRYVAEAKYLHSMGEWSEAISIIDSLETNSYYTEELSILKARSEWQLGNADESMKVLKDALNRTPHSEKLSLELVNFLLDIGQYSEAKQLALRVFERGNPSHHTRKILGFSYMKLEDWTHAQIVLSPLASGHDEEVIFWYGQVLFKQGQYQVAIPFFQKAYSHAVFKKRSAQYLAWIHTDKKDVSQAHEYIRFLILDNKESFFAQKMYTRNVLNSPNSDKVTALKLFNENYKDEWGQYNYYSELMKVGMKEDALNYLSQLWNKSPEAVWVATNYAAELQKTGDPDLARSVLSKSLNFASGTNAIVLQQYIGKIDSDISRNIANVNRVYTVQAGDSLRSISHKLFKTTKHWQHIYNLNKKNLPRSEELRVGMELKIPEGL